MAQTQATHNKAHADEQYRLPAELVDALRAALDSQPLPDKKK